MYKNLIFDLDGTILNTLGDISYSVNLALNSFGHKANYNSEQVKALVGSGSKQIFVRALQDKQVSEQELEEILGLYLDSYAHNHLEHSFPYEGISDLLSSLNKQGYKLFCLTNKPHAIAQSVIKHFFPNIFIEVVGQIEGYPLKPDPTLLNDLFNKYNLIKDETLYIGDSDIDMKTANNGGLAVVFVSWGFRIYEDVKHLKPTYKADSAKQLEAIITQ